MFETFGAAAVAEGSAWCGSREACTGTDTETESARAESPAITMTLGTCGSSGKAAAACALAREDSQKSGVNGWEAQKTSLLSRFRYISRMTVCPYDVYFRFWKGSGKIWKLDIQVWRRLGGRGWIRRVNETSVLSEAVVIDDSREYSGQEKMLTWSE